MRASRAWPWPIARARQARQALSVAVVTAASVKRRLLMSVIGASLVKEAQTRVLMIACCEPQMTATALSASRAGSRPAMQPAVAASSPRISWCARSWRACRGNYNGTIAPWQCRSSVAWSWRAHSPDAAQQLPSHLPRGAFRFHASILPVAPGPSSCVFISAFQNSVPCIPSPFFVAVGEGGRLLSSWTSTRQRRRVGYAGHPWRAVEAWGHPLHPPRP